MDGKEPWSPLAEGGSIFQTIVESAPLGIAYVGADFRFRRVNRALCAMLGYGEAELVGRSFVDITHPDDVDRDADLAGQVFRGEIEQYRIEKRYVARDGRLVYGSLTARIIEDGGERWGLAMVEDITDRVLAARAIEQSEARYRALTEQAADGILLFDQGGRCVEANGQATAMFGWSQPELREMGVEDLVVPDDLAALPPQIERVRSGEVVLTERLLRRRGDEPFPAEIRSRQLPDGTIQSIVRDVTARKAAEREREALIEQLQAALLQVQQLRGLLPICAACKQIRDEHDCWHAIEEYISVRSQAEFTHSICPACAERLYPGLLDEP